MSRKFRILAGALVALTAAPALAQTPAPVATPLSGPVIAGVCLLSREAIFANAAVGKAASARLAELTQAAQAEINAEGEPVQAQARALEAQPQTEATRQSAQALARQWQALQQKAAHNGQEIEATRRVVLDRISAEAQPVIAEVYGRQNCGLLFDRNTALGGNFANDLTAAVVQGLDARVTTISFDRERLVQAAPGAVDGSR